MEVASHEVVREQSETPRLTLAYFDHEFSRLPAKKIDNDISEIVDIGFTDVVLTVSEGDMRSKARRHILQIIKREMEARGLTLRADPWHVGNIFGGEAKTYFEEEMGCFCNPKLHKLVHEWLGFVAMLGFEGVFFDEPEMKCKEHKHKGYEFGFLEEYTSFAGELGLASTVVLPADERHIPQFAKVAALPDVVRLGVDPYFPNAFKRDKITEAMRPAYVEWWMRFIADIANAAGKKSEGWVQSFDVPEGQESMISEHLAIARQYVGSIAVWGFHGCEAIADNVLEFRKPGTLSPVQHWGATVRPIREFSQEAGKLVA